MSEREFSVGDKVRASPVVGNSDHGTMHEVFTGMITQLISAENKPFEGVEVAFVDPDSTDAERPVRVSNLEPVPSAVDDAAPSGGGGDG